MIAKGKIRADGAKLARYLMTGEKGEIAQLIETRGLEVSAATRWRPSPRWSRPPRRTPAARSRSFTGISGLRPASGLRTSNGCKLVDRMEKRLGFAGQPRMVSFHIDQATGEKHLHVAWFRVDLETMRAIDPGMYKNHLKQLSRRLEKEFALREVSNTRQPHDRARAADRNEFEESRRLGTDVREIRTAILDCLEQSDGGKAFKAALEGRGFDAGERRPPRLLRCHRPGGRTARAQQEAHRPDPGGDARTAGRPRPQPVAERRTGERDAGRRGSAQEARQQPEHGRGVGGARGGGAGPDGPSAAPQPEIKPLGQTAGEIRLAWQLTKTADQFAQAIEDRGLILVHVSREEAEASQRAAAFAKAIGRQNRALKEGFAVVDRRGNVTRIDQRATGDHWEEIQKRLAGIDRRELVSVADAKEAMREANRIEWREQRRAEREAARPATALETAINDLHQEAADGKQFAEALDKAGVTIARATAADVKALDALRQDQELNGIVADAAGIEQGRAQHFARLEEGDLAAVTRRGDVFRISARRLEHGVEARLAEAGPAPGVIEARAALEIEREAAATFQQQMIDTQLERRTEATEARVGSQRSAGRQARARARHENRSAHPWRGDRRCRAERQSRRSPG